LYGEPYQISLLAQRLERGSGDLAHEFALDARVNTGISRYSHQFQQWPAGLLRRTVRHHGHARSKFRSDRQPDPHRPRVLGDARPESGESLFSILRIRMLWLWNHRLWFQSPMAAAFTEQGATPRTSYTREPEAAPVAAATSKGHRILDGQWPHWQTRIAEVLSKSSPQIRKQAG